MIVIYCIDAMGKIVVDSCYIHSSTTWGFHVLPKDTCSQAKQRIEPPPPLWPMYECSVGRAVAQLVKQKRFCVCSGGL